MSSKKTIEKSTSFKGEDELNLENSPSRGKNSENPDPSYQTPSRIDTDRSKTFPGKNEVTPKNRSFSKSITSANGIKTPDPFKKRPRPIAPQTDKNKFKKGEPSITDQIRGLIGDDTLSLDSSKLKVLDPSTYKGLTKAQKAKLERLKQKALRDKDLPDPQSPEKPRNDDKLNISNSSPLKSLASFLTQNLSNKMRDEKKRKMIEGLVKIPINEDVHKQSIFERKSLMAYEIITHEDKKQTHLCKKPLAYD